MAKVYARPNGRYYHTTKRCPMLAGGDFKFLGYKEIAWKDVREQELRPCACVKDSKGKT